jgi:hypothetical protein
MNEAHPLEASVEGYTPPPAGLYYDVFVRDPSGARVLEHLQAMFFDRPGYRPGGLEGQRETDRRAAHREVVDFIHRQIAAARAGRTGQA